MTDRTHSQPAVTGWQHSDQPTADPTDSLRASIHPTGQAVTVQYWGSGDALVLDVARLDSLVCLLGQVRHAAALPADVADDMLRAPVTRSYWPGISVSLAPPDALRDRLLRVNGAVK